MKTAIEIYSKWITSPASQQMIFLDTLKAAMNEYALQVAAEQDKITRHAAAELVAENFIRKEADERVWFQTADKVHSEIMNLQTKIKELK